MNLSPKKPTKTKMETKKKPTKKPKNKAKQIKRPKGHIVTFKGVPINKAFTKL